MLFVCYRSDVYLSGIRKDPDTGAYFIVTATELRNIINRERHMRPTDFDNLFITDVQVLIDFSLSVKAATLIFISGRGSAISSAKQGKSGSIYNLVKNK